MKNNILSSLIIFITFFLLVSCKNNKQEIISEIEGVQYYQSGKYEEAFPLLKNSADSGNAIASYYLGEMYRKGEGIDKDGNMACRRYLESAERENVDAYLLTSVCYYLGKGFEQNYTEAFKWGKKVSEEIDETKLSEYDRERYAILMSNLYVQGKGTLQDFSEAAKWAEKASRLGDAESQAMMAFFLFAGKGVLSDSNAARYWAEQSAEQGNAMGQTMMGMLIQYRSPTEPDMKAAIRWYEKSAKQGNPAAQYQLATIYENGKGVPKDLNKARYYYEQAAKSKLEIPLEAFLEFEEEQKENSGPHCADHCSRR